jgi:predicted transglutaminase-like cysteine proteinase
MMGFKDALFEFFGGIGKSEYEQIKKELKIAKEDLASANVQYHDLWIENQGLNENLRICEKTLISYQKDAGKEITDLQKEIARLTKDNIHASLDRFRQFVETILPSPKYYDFGKGKRQVHTIFADAMVSDERIAIVDFMDKYDLIPQWTDSDSVVMEFSKRFSKKFPTKIYYEYDEELYGKGEYWALPSETIKNLKKGKFGDCDDIMVLKWACLNYLVAPFDLWRLRGFIVDLWSGGGHAILGWVDKDKNDWVPIETTFRDTDQAKISDYTIRNQLFYQIRYSFDDKHEYERI